MGYLVIAQVAIMAIAEVVSLLTAPGDPRYGAELNDLRVSASTYGKTIQCGYGVQRCPGNMIWSLPLKQYSHAGKGLGQSTYSYNWTGAMGICEGPIVDILQIWADTKIVFDKTGQYGADFCNQNAGTYPNPIRFQIYYGTEDQMPDPNNIIMNGANATAHRGMAYVVFENTPITNYGNRVPNYTFVVAFQNAATQAFTVRNFDIDQGSSDATPRGDLAFQDWSRSRAYFTVQSPPAAGLTYCDLVSGDTIYSNTFTDMFAHFPNGSTGLSPDGFLVPGFDGFVYGNTSLFGVNPIFKIDGDALICVGEYDFPAEFQINALPLQIGGVNYLAMLGQFGTINSFCTDTMSVVTTEQSSLAATDENQRIGPGSLNEDISGNPYAYFFKIGYSNTTTNPLNMYIITMDQSGGLVEGLIGSINPSDVNLTWNNITSVAGMAFDQADGNLIFGVQNSIDTIGPGVSDNYIVKVSVTSGDVLWAAPVNQIPDTAVFAQQQAFTLNAITDAQYCFIGNEKASFNGAGDHSPPGYVGLYTIDTTTGTYVRANWAMPTHDSQTYDGNHGSLLYYGTLNPTYTSDQWLLLYTNRAQAAAVPLSDVVTDLVGRVGLSPSQINVTALAGIGVDGYVIGDSKSCKDALMPLSVAYQFDAMESDGLLNFVPRGASSADTVPVTSLGYIDTKTNALSKETRTQEVDLPRVLSVSFFDPNHDYQRAYQYSQRPRNPVPTMFSNNRKQVSLDLVLEPDAAKQLADKILYTGWVERTSYKFKLSWDRLVYDPTDVITFDLADDTSVITRLVDVDVGADLSVEITACSESAETYVSNSTTDGGNSFPQNTNPSSATKLFLFDSPLMRDIDDTGFSHTLLYWSAGAYSSASGWNGVELFKSLDGTAYVDLNGITISDSWGVCINALGDDSYPFRTDYVNTLNVAMIVGGDNLASVTYLQRMNGANAAAIWNPLTGIIELIQFQDVTANADGTFTLSTLTRGRRGSEVYTGLHTAGDYFVLLATDSGAVASGVQTATLSLSDMNVQEYFKGVPTGTLLANAQQVNFKDTGRTWKPYAPTHLQAVTSGSDIDLSWVRRTRVGGPLMDGTGIVPLSEQDEHYSVDIYNALGDTVLRTIDVDYHSTSPTATPGVTYTNAEIIADFGSTPSSINMIVYQIGTIGRGFGKMYNVVVDAPPTP